jgi:hypothetical protein
MTGQVGSAVVTEITSRIITKVLQIFNIQPGDDEKLHKLDMLCIHIHGVVESTKECRINCEYLLRWQEKLKEAATDGDEVRFSAFSEATRGTNHQIGTHHAVAYADIATPSMFHYFRSATKMLLSCSQDVQKLNITLERLEKLSADTEQFLRLIDLEESMKEEHVPAKGKNPVVISRSPSLQKEEHQSTKRKRTLDSTNMLQSVKR